MIRPRLVLAASLLSALMAVAATGKTPAKDAAPLEVDPLISVEIDSSRPQLVAGEGLGVIARVRNTSKVPVYIRETSFSLTVPLEMEGSRGGVNGYAAFFPTEIHKGDEKTPTEEYYKHVMRLNPGDTYSAFWTNTFAASSDSSLLYIFRQISSQFQFLFFTPGRYSITLTAKYWTDPELTNYRTLTREITVPVVAPLFVILFGAALGGLVAHFVLPRALQPQPSKLKLPVRILQAAAGVFGSALLSVIVTIILSRVSETKFLVSVTVNDIWGAIVTGFIANYVGYKVLGKLLPADPEAKQPGGKKDS